MRFKTTRCSESGYQQARPVSDVRPRLFSEQGDSTHLANTSGMPSNFTLDDTKTHASSTSKQRKAGSPRETATRHSARKGDLKGSLAVSTDESRDRIKTGPPVHGARRKSIIAMVSQNFFVGEAATNCRNLTLSEWAYPSCPEMPAPSGLLVRLKESACAPA